MSNTKRQGLEEVWRRPRLPKAAGQTKSKTFQLAPPHITSSQSNKTNITAFFILGRNLIGSGGKYSVFIRAPQPRNGQFSKLTISLVLKGIIDAWKAVKKLAEVLLEMGTISCPIELSMYFGKPQGTIWAPCSGKCYQQRPPSLPENTHTFENISELEHFV